MPGTPGCQVPVGPHPLVQTCHYTCSFCNALVNLTVKWHVAGDDQAKVTEVVTDLKHLVVNSDGGGRRNVLTHDFCLPYADGQAKLLTGMGDWLISWWSSFSLCMVSAHHQQKVAPWWGLCGLLLELSNGGDPVHCGPLAPEAALGFSVDALCEDLESDYTTLANTLPMILSREMPR